MTQRVITYIDGFNLYYGLKEKNWRKYYWLDLQKLSENLLKPGQDLVKVKYFTASISGGDDSSPAHLTRLMEAKRLRQLEFLEALSTLDKLQMFEGQFLNKMIRCGKCGNCWLSPEEKMTDVNIVTELLFDTFTDSFDTALVISGDSDLVPPIRALRLKYPFKKVVAVFPPKRFSENLRINACAYMFINEYQLRKSLFPDEVRKPDGSILKRPQEWK